MQQQDSVLVDRLHRISRRSRAVFDANPTAKSRERSIDAFGVAGIGPDQNIHVLGRAWMAMEGYCVPTQQHELRASIGQL